MVSMDTSDIAILNIHGASYGCIMYYAEYRFDQKKWNIIKHKSLWSYIKMSKEILTFGDIDVEEDKFYWHKRPIF